MHNDKSQNISKKVLVYLPAGIVTKPVWLFDHYTTSSLAKHGIRKVTTGRRTYRSDGIKEDVEFVVQTKFGDLVTRITADTPITYAGFNCWEV